MVNPYDTGSVRRYVSLKKAEAARRNYIRRETNKLNFEYDQDSINPYDLGQVARIRQMFKDSRELYSTRRKL